MDKILLERLRNKYIKNPPEGMTPDDIKHMSDSDLLDMDYFLNEDEDDEFGEEDLLKQTCSFYARPKAGIFHSWLRRQAQFPIM